MGAVIQPQLPFSGFSIIPLKMTPTFLQRLSARSRRELAYLIVALPVALSSSATACVLIGGSRFWQLLALLIPAAYIAFRFVGAPLFLQVAVVPSVGYAAKILAGHVQRARRAGMTHPMHLYFDDPTYGRHLVSLLSIPTPTNQAPSEPDEWPPYFEPEIGSVWLDRHDGYRFTLVDADKSANSITLKGETEKTSIWVGTAKQLLERYRRHPNPDQ